MTLDVCSSLYSSSASVAGMLRYVLELHARDIGDWHMNLHCIIPCAMALSSCAAVYVLQPGELDIGRLNPSRYTGRPVWAPVVPANSSVRTNAQTGTLVSGVRR